jgi:hypothetical protein
MEGVLQYIYSLGLSNHYYSIFSWLFIIDFLNYVVLFKICKIINHDYIFFVDKINHNKIYNKLFKIK